MLIGTTVAGIGFGAACSGSTRTVMTNCGGPRFAAGHVALSLMTAPTSANGAIAILLMD
jgi:hypothetical protein